MSWRSSRTRSRASRETGATATGSCEWSSDARRLSASRRQSARRSARGCRRHSPGSGEIPDAHRGRHGERGASSRRTQGHDLHAPAQRQRREDLVSVHNVEYIRGYVLRKLKHLRIYISDSSPTETDALGAMEGLKGQQNAADIADFILDHLTHRTPAKDANGDSPARRQARQVVGRRPKVAGSSGDAI